MATPTEHDRSFETVGQRLREARRSKGLTQQQVADRLEVSRRAVSEWETDLRKPHVTIPGLAALYETSETFLLYGVEPSSVELQAMREAVDENRTLVIDLSEQVAAARGDLVRLAETLDQTFAEIRRLLELRQSELGRSDEKQGDGRPDER